jgi:hypothetical protein
MSKEENTGDQQGKNSKWRREGERYIQGDTGM